MGCAWDYIRYEYKILTMVRSWYLAAAAGSANKGEL